MTTASEVEVGSNTLIQLPGRSAEERHFGNRAAQMGHAWASKLPQFVDRSGSSLSGDAPWLMTQYAGMIVFCVLHQQSMVRAQHRRVARAEVHGYLWQPQRCASVASLILLRVPAHLMKESGHLMSPVWLVVMQ